MIGGLVGLVVLAYAPHLLEEHFTRQYDDSIIVLAFSPLAQMPPRESGYLSFQVMFAALLVMIWLYSLGGRWQKLVLAMLAVALIGESHHLIRALVSRQYNSGLVTALPMPFIGAYVLRRVLK